MTAVLHNSCLQHTVYVVSVSGLAHLHVAFLFRVDVIEGDVHVVGFLTHNHSMTLTERTSANILTTDTDIKSCNKYIEKIFFLFDVNIFSCTLMIKSFCRVCMMMSFSERHYSTRMHYIKVTFTLLQKIYISNK